MNTSSPSTCHAYICAVPESILRVVVGKEPRDLSVPSYYQLGSFCPQLMTYKSSF